MEGREDRVGSRGSGIGLATEEEGVKACRYDQLHREVALYLDFYAVAHDDDHLWREYVAWKRLTAKRAQTLAERLSRYTMR